MTEPTERQKMLAGQLYDATDPELCAQRRHARDIMHQLNATRDEEGALRQQLYRALFGRMGDRLWIEPPFYCDYGNNIYFGDRVYFNFNCVVLDCAEVTVGSDVLFGPGVQIYTATHPLDYRVRRQWLEAARPITVGSDVWVGGAAILCPGVTVGDRSVIGAGSVVTKDIPAGVFAAGNPCRVLKELA